MVMVMEWNGIEWFGLAGYSYSHRIRMQTASIIAVAAIEERAKKNQAKKK